MQPPDRIACTFSVSSPEPGGRIDPTCGQGQGTHLPPWILPLRVSEGRTVRSAAYVSVNALWDKYGQVVAEENSQV